VFSADVVSLLEVSEVGESKQFVWRSRDVRPFFLGGIADDKLEKGVLVLRVIKPPVR